MRIKNITNHKMTSFEFTFDLSKADFLKNVVELYQTKDVYICIYGLTTNDILHSKSELQIREMQVLSSTLGSQDLVIKIKVENLSKLTSIAKGNFDEITIWSCFADWDTFLKKIRLPKFISFSKQKRKNGEEEPPSFYLSFKHYDFDEVEIICDLEFNPKVTKDDLVKVLTH